MPHQAPLTPRSNTMNDDPCLKAPVFPRRVEAWETSDHRLFAIQAADVADAHEATLKAALEKNNYAKTTTSMP
jgi:hypothetical protein